MFKQFIQTWAIILVAGIVAYASPAARRSCCHTFSGTCMPAVAGTQGSHATGGIRETSPACRHGCKLNLVPACETFSVPADAENTCCRTEQCDSSNQAVYFSFSFSQHFDLIRQETGDTPSAEQSPKAFATDSLSTSPKVVAIYLLTQSIIC